MHFIPLCNTIGANQNIANNGYVDKTVSGNVVGVSSNVVLYTTNSNKSFVTNEIVYQVNDSNTVTANGVVLKYTSTVGSNGILEVSNTFGVFRSSRAIYSSNSLVSNLDSVELKVGVHTVNGTYTSYNNNYFYANSEKYDTTATVKNIGFGAAAAFSISKRYAL